MPELPEVETTIRGIKDTLLNQKIIRLKISNPNLRWPVPETINDICNHHIKAISRRAKYILIKLSNEQHLIIHLGMSGNLRLEKTDQQHKKHDHAEFLLQNDFILKFNDPRRFGCILLTDNPQQHRLIANLGLEPFSKKFTGAYLKQQAKSRSIKVKTFIMDHKVVVGVGNIYASESLFLSAINPNTAANKISLKRYQNLAQAIVKVLEKSINAGGTTLKDFHGNQGKAGYFQQQLEVYDRQNQACHRCNGKIKKTIIAQRASYYCPNCQHW